MVWVAISTPGDLPNSGIEPVSPVRVADSLPLSNFGTLNADSTFLQIVAFLIVRKSKDFNFPLFKDMFPFHSLLKICRIKDTEF